MTLDSENQPVNAMKHRILIIDDVPNRLEMVAVMLENNGYAAFTMLASAFSVEAVSAIQPHIAVVNLLMPASDIMRLTRQIHQLVGYLRLPIIMNLIELGTLTSTGTPDEKPRYSMRGYQSEELLREIRRLLSATPGA